MPDYDKLSRKAHAVLGNKADMDCAQFFSAFYKRISPAEKDEIKEKFNPMKKILPLLGLRFLREVKSSGRVARSDSGATAVASGAPQAAPSKARAKSKPIYVVKYDHETDGKELFLKVGQVVNVTDKGESGWWYVQVGDKAGWSPADYMEERTGGRARASQPAQANPTPASEGLNLERLDHLAKTILSSAPNNVLSSGAFFTELYKKIGPEQASALRETYKPSSLLFDDLPSVGHTKTDKSSAIVHLVNTDAPRNAQPVRFEGMAHWHDGSLSDTSVPRQESIILT